MSKVREEKVRHPYQGFVAMPPTGIDEPFTVLATKDSFSGKELKLRLTSAPHGPTFWIYEAHTSVSTDASILKDLHGHRNSLITPQRLAGASKAVQRFVRANTESR